MFDLVLSKMIYFIGNANRFTENKPLLRVTAT